MTDAPSSPAAQPPRRTPLFEAHVKAGARMVPFAGWMMPVQYPGGILEEHRQTREAVGLFDVCHMGELRLRGPRAVEACQRVVTQDVARLPVGMAAYGVACHPTGGIIDDLIVYKAAEDDLLVIVNAANRDKDAAWFASEAGKLAELVDLSDDTGLLAFQGPKAERALATLTAAPLTALPFRAFVPKAEVAGRTVSLARTGYTAEDGFEIVCRAADAPALWEALLEAAAKEGGGPVGLGARDTLRLEGRLSLYGQDLDDTTTPLEAGLGWVVKWDKGDFIGKQALLAQKAEGPKRKLAGFVMRGRGTARHDYPLLDLDKNPVGRVTSGAPSPTLGVSIGLGYVPPRLAAPGTRLLADCRGKTVEAEVVEGPFYKRPK